MKKIINALILISTCFLFTHCSEKFNIAAPYKDITVVFGFLDQNDTAHYIRIQKAFLDDKKSAITMAKTADSSFYKSLHVIIKRLDMNFNMSLIDTIALIRVDLNAEGYQKQPGMFFDAPNYAYKFKGKLNSNYIYRLVITNTLTGVVDSAETPIISEDSTIFSVQKLDDDNPITNKIDFSSTIEGRMLDLSGSYIQPNYNYNGSTLPVGIAQMVIRFNWADSNNSTFKHDPKYFDYDLGFGAIAPNGSIDFKVKNTQLFTELATGMNCAPINIYRLLDRCQLFVYLGTQEYNTYLQISYTQGTGLTGSEIEPTYTNIKGANVLGLFTSRALRSGYVTVTPSTIKALELDDKLKNCCRLVGTTYP